MVYLVIIALSLVLGVNYMSDFFYVIKRRPDKVDYLQHMIELMLSRGHYRVSFFYYRLAIKLQIKDPLFDFLHGLILYRQREYQGAKRVFERAKASAPDFDEVDNIIGDTLIQLKDYEHAKPFLDHFLLIHPDNVFARINLAIAEYRTEHLQDALRMLNQALELDRVNLLALKLKGSVLMRLKDHEGALACYTRYQGLGGQDKAVHYNVMRLLKWLNRNADRRDYAKTLLENGLTDAHVYTHYGDALCHLGDFNQGIRMLNEALALDDHQAEAHYLLAKLFAVTHHQHKALEHLKFAIHNNPKYVLRAREDEDLNNLRFFNAFYALINH